MRRPLPFVLVASTLMIGCTLPPGLLTVPNGQDTSTSRKKPGALEPAEALNGVEFKPIASSKFLESETTAAQPTSANAPAPAATDGGFSSEVLKGISTPGGPMPPMTGGIVSGNIYGGYSFGHYFGPQGGGTEPMALVSITGAEAAGAAGSFQEVLKSVVAPMVKDWAPDARLVTSSASLGNDGQPYVSPSMPPIETPYGKRPYPGPYGPEESGWRLTYTSSGRNEVLNFVVTAEKTTVIRLRYAPLDLQPETITVDSHQALSKLIAAIEDANFKSEEEKTGQDYFMGFSFGDQPPFQDPYAPKIEPVYEVSDQARWNVTLQSIMGQPVWEMNFHVPDTSYMARPMPMPMPVAPPVAVEADASGAAPVVTPSAMPMPVHTPSSYHFDNSGNGMVDARTGAVIRFRRPSKIHHQMMPGPSPYPIKMPPPYSPPPPKPTPTPAVDA